MIVLDIKITEKKAQVLLSRTKVHGIVGFEAATPSRPDLKKKVAEALKVAEQNVSVTLIDTAFGEKKAKFEAHVYSSPEDLKKFESSVVLARQGLKEKKAKAEAKPAK